ncbi:DUF559 domain-containing protein [Rhodococcus sp. BP-241]|uniref:endonuclease domain-containing protein n=1 Tax=Rhodococcus sp. BP-241 TaxID=2739441 RepID=UPI0027DF169A|nr:DUF559 domain-containing protein [Rhodococcus sp. BP-241]
MTTRVDTATPWWHDAPLDRVVRLSGAAMRDLAESVDPLPSDAPAALFFTLSNGSASEMVDAVVAAIEQAALDLVPFLLPGDVGDRSSLARDAARTRARQWASTSEHFGPYLAHLAGASTSGRPLRVDAFARETRAAGAARVIADVHGRERAVLVVDVPADADPAAVATAAEWWCSTGTGVWLTGAGAPAVDRFPVLTVRTPSTPDDVDTIVDRFRPLSYPPVEGRPHAASAAEILLDRVLSTREWAAGRRHNRSVRPTTLSRPFTLDVSWVDERVAIEIDGHEHRARAQFADDRSRDNLLQTHGWIVLRFTNEDVLADHESVMTMIEQALHRRRSKGTPT